MGLTAHPKGAVQAGRFLLCSLAALHSLIYSSIILTRSTACLPRASFTQRSSIAQPNTSLCSARLNFLFHPSLNPRISLTFESSVLQTQPFPDPFSSQ